MKGFPQKCGTPLCEWGIFFSMRLVEKVPRILTLTFMPVQGPKSIIALCTGRKNGNFLDNK